MSIQQLLLGATSGKKSYLDKLFSTYLWRGNNTIGRNIVNDLDLSTENGLVWVKKLDSSENHVLLDTVRGPNNFIFSDGNNAASTSGGPITAFNTNGFTVDNNGYVNANNGDYASWTFKESPGLLDIVTYTGTGSGSAITVSHNLGSMPGFIALKDLDNSENWICWHRDMGYSSNADYIKLNASHAMGTDGASPPNASINSVTATQMVIGKDNNANNADYIVYVFGGGESTASNATSVDFDGNASGGHMDELSIPDSTDFDLGTTFTWEFWIRHDEALTDWRIPFRRGSDSDLDYYIQINANGRLQWTTEDNKNCDSANKAVPRGQWTHCAFVANSGSGQWYVNGTASGKPHTGITGTGYGGPLYIGGWGNNSSYYFDGALSNVRIVKGVAVYTSSFRPPTEPLKNITGTVLLCCNGSSVTSSTVTPNTISSDGDVTASTDSPFDDTAGFVFGDSKEGVIKCGVYHGNNASDGPEIFCGWEPEWILIKDRDANVNWRMHDVMRGIATGANDKELEANTTDEEGSSERISVTPRGFKIDTDSGSHNTDDIYYYIAIRRQDPYVSTPPEAGTDVFAMDTGNGSGTIPAFDSNFPVDYAIVRKEEATDDWDTMARLMYGGSTSYLQTNGNSAETTGASNFTFDSNVGWAINNGSTLQSWMWKRYQGFDAVTYKGNSSGNSSGDLQVVPHNLNAVPEMMWVKCRNDSGEARSWFVYHKGLNGGTNPQNWNLKLNSNTDEAEDSNRWNNTAPSSTHFTVGAYEGTNASGDDYIAILFASVNGISKLGSYTGNGSTGQTITVGFQPRYLIIKCVSEAADWQTFDTVRGLGNSFDPALEFNTTDAQDTVSELNKTSTAFILGNHDKTNKNNAKFIYYAHA